MKTRYCRDYGGNYGLTCGYWVTDPARIDRHLLAYHANDPAPVYDIDRDELEPGQ